jgi:DNA-binding GntR family transcriptional regulator
LHVSRTPVREALYRLAQEGVVQVLRRRGFAVARMTRRDVRELYEIRLGLEILAVRLGGPQLAPVALEAAQQAHDTMAELMFAGAEGAIAAFHTADWILHHSLFVAAQNRRLLAMREGLQAQLDVLQVYGMRLEPMMRLSIEHHAAILAALSAGDWRAAEEAMSRHVAEMELHALAIFDKHEP